MEQPDATDPADTDGGASPNPDMGLESSTGGEQGGEASTGGSREGSTGGTSAPGEESTVGPDVGPNWPTDPPPGFFIESAEHEDTCVESVCSGLIDTSVLFLRFRLEEPGQVEVIWHDFSVDGSPLELSDDPLSVFLHEVEHTDPVTFVMDHRPEPSCGGPGWEQTTGEFLVTFNGSPFVLQAPSVGHFGFDQPC